MMLAARLLTPEEVGIFMVGSSVVLMTEIFRDFGVSIYIIQSQDIDRERIRTAFTITFIISALLGCGLCAVRVPIATFYDEPRLAIVLAVASLSFFVAPFSSPILSLLKREMAFGRISVINICATVVNLASFCVLALLGFGFMSLAWSSLASALSISVIALILRPDFWIFRPLLQNWRDVLTFGGYSSATLVINNISQSLPQLILGRFSSFDVVGFYSRATALCQLPERFIISALQPVVLPAFAAQVREGRSISETYLHAISLTTAVQWPTLLCVAFLADPIVQLVLGSQWAAVAPLVRIMAVAMLTMFPAFLTYPVLVAVGRVKDTLTASLISLPPSMLLVAWAATHSVQAVAATMLITGPFQVYVALCFIRRYVPFRWAEMGAATWRSALVALASASAPIATVALSGGFDVTLPAMFVASVAALLGWLFGLALTEHPLLAEMRILVRHIASTVAVLADIARAPATARNLKEDQWQAS
jgi:O-antigen/teichoic acid export membrane protein